MSIKLTSFLKIIFILYFYINITNVYANSIKNSAVVFMYHKFGISKYPSTNVTIEQLDSHINELSKEKYNIRSLDFIVDTIIRYENLETEFLSLLDKLNINYNVDHFFLRGVDGLSRENVSSDSFKFYFHPPGNKDYRELYNTDTKNLVEEYQMKTIKHFNYKF